MLRDSLNSSSGVTVEPTGMTAGLNRIIGLKRGRPLVARLRLKWNILH
jgi:hypothetical protein